MSKAGGIYIHLGEDVTNELANVAEILGTKPERIAELIIENTEGHVWEVVRSYADMILLKEQS